ncbi:MAG TPA: periplasmic heavy metal sensor [Myxococcota bacterium]|nr:periplasmic heavy metal sensor [Myxococcota bacterium]
MRRWLMLGWLAIGAVAWARPEPEAMAARLATELGLDDATRGKVAARLGEAVDEGRPLREKAEALEADLRAEQAKPQPDLRHVDKLVHQLAALRADGVMVRIRAAVDIEALLTPEQVAKFRELRAKQRREEEDLGGL